MNKLSVEDFNPLHELLSERTGADFIVETTPWGGVWFRSDENELYLKNSFGKTLIISRIALRKKRKGIATEIFHWLKNFAELKNFESILIESTLTPEMNRFAEKHGFKKIESQGAYFDGDFFGNYQYILKKTPI